MKRLLVILCLIPSVLSAFTEFYCDAANGSNLNGGSSTATSVYTSTNGNWNGTSTFTPTDGSNPATANPGCTVGDFASVYLDAASVAVFIARVTAVTNGTNGAITVSTTAKAGTPPTSGATGRTIKCGGVWKGPNAASGFPIAFSGTSLSQATNAGGEQVRVNFKNNSTYSVTSSVTGTAQTTQLLLQGYSSSVGDGGRATLDAGGNNFTPVISLSQSQNLYDFIVSNVGVSAGTGAGITLTSGNNTLFRVVVHDVRGTGIIATTNSILIESEVYAFNKSNTASSPGIFGATAMFIKRCYIHDGTGSNCDGIITVGASGAWSIDGSILDTLGGNGIVVNSSSSSQVNGSITNNDFYNNTGSGIKVGSAAANFALYIENNNFIKNGAYGIDGGASFTRLTGYLYNNGYGSGTQANSSGDYHTTGALVLDDNTGTNSRRVYASNVTPYFAPTTGDFRISLAAAMGVGRGAFTQTDGTNTGTVGYPDLGAAQHNDTCSGLGPCQTSGASAH